MLYLRSMFNLIAHAGEHHESTVEAATHLGQDVVILWLVLILAPIAIAFFSHTVLKLRLLNTLLWISVFLIAFSVYSYQNPGIYTAVALAGGFGIVFITTILRLISE